MVQLKSDRIQLLKKEKKKKRAAKSRKKQFEENDGRREWIGPWAAEFR